ncbi:unnamed protein product [Calicophoron daubneyi]|uniref:SET domain-containing protein n=1 Tax=Calicophoron daubneyi TaxID=300641 RepID=A0AAV2T226_CALDB
MDIRRKTTFLSRNSDGRPTHTYCPFFQSAQKKYFNVDPNSGLHLVGPMFELTACVELRGDDEDFDAVYPESSLSYGPTICSFGLKYNDHNYALPSGLTPPSMAPHLMDVHPPRDKCTTEAHSTTEDSSRVYGQEDSPKEHLEPNSSGDGVASSDGKKVPKPWSAKNKSNRCVATGDSCNREKCVMPRHGKGAVVFEHMEMRYEPELKVIEVPEELAVSPSQLSDLDSDLSDDGYANTKIVPAPAARTIVLDGTVLSDVMCNNIRCPCGSSQNKTRLIRCLQCNFYQHVVCMEALYNTPLPLLCEGYTCNHCRGTSSLEQHGSQRFTALSVSQSNVQGNQSSEIVTIGSSIPTDQSTVVLRLETNSITNEDGTQDISKCAVSKEGTIGAQYVEVTADRAKSLGLISHSASPELPGSRSTTSIPASVHFGRGGAPVSKDHEAGSRPGWNSVDWERLNELSRSTRRVHGDTDVNLRMPSPPRASKRKQDLTTTSYNDADTSLAESVDKGLSTSMGSEELSSSGVTPVSTPSSTPYKLPASSTPCSTPGHTLTPGSECSGASGLENSPVHPHLSADKRQHKSHRNLFPESGTPTKRRFNPRTHPLGAVWAKDYREAESDAYTKALLDYIESRLAASLERNYRIPPACLTRTPLCRVVLFDHDDKGIEASVRLGPNEVVTEVRGQFLLLEEYEHYVDPTSEYNRYVLFYHGFGDRDIVIDSSQYGNSARFIRRSCIPNCRLEHYIVQSKLQIVIRTSMEVMPGTELTIPFDLDYHACRYPLDCACARSRCPVLKWRRKLLRNKVVPNLDYSKYIESQLRALSKPLSQESPNSRTGLFDPSPLSGSPLMKTSIGNSSRSSIVSLPGSPSQTGAQASPGSSAVNRPSASNLNSLSSRSRNADDYLARAEKSSSSTAFPTSRFAASTSVGSDSITDENEMPANSEASDQSSESAHGSPVNPTQIHSKPVAPDKKLTFEPIITTRRQAAAMRNVR